MFIGRMSDEIPLVALDVVTDVDLGFVAVKVNVEFESVVRPRTELHVTLLYVERKVRDVDAAAGPVDGRRYPQYLAITLDDHHCLTLLLQPLVSTAASYHLHTYHHHHHHPGASILRGWDSNLPHF